VVGVKKAQFMNRKQSLGIGIFCIAAACSTQGQSFLFDRLRWEPSGAGYAPREFSFDFGGGYATRDKGGADKDAYGIALGVNYFITENIGAGADTYFDAFTLPYLMNFSAIYRYPLWDTGLAPYAFGGFGRQWDHAAQWSGHIGAGVEFRLNVHTGVFLDGRRVFEDRTSDYALWRLGFRVGF